MQAKIAGHLYILEAYIDKQQLTTAVFYLYLVELLRKTGKKEKKESKLKKINQAYQL